MSSALRVGVKRVAAATARPVQAVPRRAMSDGQTRLVENRKIFQANPHLHGEKRQESVAMTSCVCIWVPLSVFYLVLVLYHELLESENWKFWFWRSSASRTMPTYLV